MSEQLFSKEELSRYARHFSLPEFGMSAQQKLKTASVLVVGAGGLGCPLLLYLAAAGVGKIGIVDFDKVDDSNLQRQVLYGVQDVGKYKVEVARERVVSLNPHIEVVLYKEALSSRNALDTIKDYDVVADGTDNFPTRYLVNDACVLLNKVNVYGSIFRFEGQVSVFNYPLPDGGRGPNYRDLFPEPPPPGLVPSCAEGGVLGVLPGIIGSMQASEVIKVLAGVGEPLAGRLFLFDAAAFTSRVLQIQKVSHTHAQIQGLIDYEEFCGIPKAEEASYQRINVETFRRWQASGEAFVLIDVREPYEYEAGHMGGKNIPLGRIADAIDQIPKDQKVVVHCRSGQRSAKAIKQLQELATFDQLYNLEGGIQAWQSFESSL
ncbi:MAG: molybdopterin-synthase adenylyltransferase MoeB [Bacteroidota bacterium]